MPPQNWSVSRDPLGPLFQLKAAENIRRKLENAPAGHGVFLSEGLFYIDEDILRAFFLIDVESMVVEVTDFRIL